MPELTPEQRVLRARQAVLTRWAHTDDRSAATAPARRGLRAKFAREIDPGGTMPAAELERRVNSLLKAHMLRMSLAASKARTAKRAAGGRHDAA